jgi:hypothetical protein
MATEIYAITDFSGETIYPAYLEQLALDDSLPCTGVSLRPHGNSDKVVFTFSSALSAPEKTTLDAIVTSYTGAGGDTNGDFYFNTHLLIDTSGLQLCKGVTGPYMLLKDDTQPANEQVWMVDSNSTSMRIGTGTDALVFSTSAIEILRTGTTVDSVDIKVPLVVTGEVTAGEPTSPSALATKGYVDARDQGVEWQPSVISVLNTPPGSPTTDDRHLVGTSPTGDYATHANEFATYNGSTWDFQVPTQGTSVVVDTPNGQLNYNGTAWINLGSIVNHANLINLTTGDPHTQYQLGSGRNAASGYAGLDGSSKLTGTQQVYGTAANTACQGNDARLSDSRTPTSHTIVSHDTTATGANLNTLTGGGNADSQHTHAALQLTSAKNSVSGYAGLDGSSKLTGSQQTYGTAADTACVGNDARLSDSRTPSTHATSHSDGGSDEITIENLATSGASGKVPTSDGSGGLTMETPAGGVFGSELNLAKNTSETTVNDAVFLSQVRLPATGNITFPAGTYLLSVSYRWTLSSTSSNFVCQVLEKGSQLGELHSQEPQDGLSKAFVTRLFHITLAAGDFNWDVQYKDGGAGTARMSDAYISIWRLL